jgi:hypothetical protein
MRQQLNMLQPNITSTALVYELNAVALAFAAEVERIVRCEHVVAESRQAREKDFARELQLMIAEVHKTTLALRYFRHNGELPPRRS